MTPTLSVPLMTLLGMMDRLFLFRLMIIISRVLAGSNLGLLFSAQVDLCSKQRRRSRRNRHQEPID